MAVSSHGDLSVIGGSYTIRIWPRPHYCDRGDWTFSVEATGDSRLDFADGFPRMFFGTLEAAEEQMEIWVSRRAECMVGPRLS